MAFLETPRFGLYSALNIGQRGIVFSQKPIAKKAHPKKTCDKPESVFSINNPFRCAARFLIDPPSSRPTIGRSRPSFRENDPATKQFFVELKIKTFVRHFFPES